MSPAMSDVTYGNIYIYLDMEKCKEGRIYGSKLIGKRGRKGWKRNT